MKLTTKGKFAVTALLDIALNVNDNLPITLQQISIRQGISLSYLEQLFVKLRRRGLVKSYKGPGGGYLLAKSLNEVNILYIIQAVDDDIDARTCHGSKNCHKEQKCITHDLWNQLTEHIYGYLAKITLQDLINQKSPQLVNNQILFMRN